MMELVTETGSVKRRRVSIAYTATRAAEGIAIVGGCAHRISRDGKGVKQAIFQAIRGMAMWGTRDLALSK